MTGAVADSARSTRRKELRDTPLDPWQALVTAAMAELHLSGSEVARQCGIRQRTFSHHFGHRGDRNEIPAAWHEPMARVLGVPAPVLAQAAIEAANMTVNVMEYGPVAVTVAWFRQDQPDNLRRVVADELGELALAQREHVDDRLPAQRGRDSVRRDEPGDREEAGR